MKKQWLIYTELLQAELESVERQLVRLESIAAGFLAEGFEAVIDRTEHSQTFCRLAQLARQAKKQGDRLAAEVERFLARAEKMD